MKKLVSILGLVALTATAASAAPSYLTRNYDGSYDVTYDYKDKAKTGWYVGGRASLSLMNWENEYSTTPEIGVNEDKESFTEAVFGANFFVGRTFNYFWRAELEGGMIGQFDDSGEGYDFKLTVPYLVANAYYDFANGFYLGAGLGIALPETKLEHAGFVSGGREERNVSLMGALMAGWSYRLDYNLMLDLRYRLAAFNGTDHERVYGDDVTVGGEDVAGVKIKNEIGLILDNSISVGLRYEF
ncbi:MAG: outer membrane protein [Alphaproteobacteria bacterium]